MHSIKLDWATGKEITSALCPHQWKEPLKNLGKYFSVTFFRVQWVVSPMLLL